MGVLDLSAYISNSFSTGSVNGGAYYAGGLVAYEYSETANPAIINSYAAGAVNGSGINGGLVATCLPCGSTQNSYWDSQITGQSTSADSGSSSELTSAMQARSTYSGWDFLNTWNSPVLGSSYPTLR